MTGISERYVLDSNVFVEASRRYYPLDFAKPFWDGLIKYSEIGILCSIDKVLLELQNGNDELKTWAETEYKEFFISTKNQKVIEAYAAIVQWAQAQSQFNQTAKDEFMAINNADTWVIAFALANNLTIVTHEVFDSNIKKKIPIPNVCRAFGIKSCDTFEMIRKINFKF
jgi:predicted nucleic acid-binding protein